MVSKSKSSSDPSKSSDVLVNSSEKSVELKKNEKKESASPARPSRTRDADKTPSIKKTHTQLNDAQPKNIPPTEPSTNPTLTGVSNTSLSPVPLRFRSSTRRSASQPSRIGIVNGYVQNINSLTKRMNEGMIEEVVKPGKFDFLVLTETKITEAQLVERKMASRIKACNKNYSTYFASRTDKGKAGVGLICKNTPINVVLDFGDPEFDGQGRVIFAEFLFYALICVYSPYNIGKNEIQMNDINKFDQKFINYVQEVKENYPQKNILIVGDLNTVSISKRYKELETLGFVDTFCEDSSGTKVGKSKRIDYCLFLDHRAQPGGFKCISSNYGNSKRGSDHYPQQVLFQR